MEQSLAEIPGPDDPGLEPGDAAAFFADFAPDARLVEFEGTVVEGRDTLVRGQQPMFDTVLKAPGWSTAPCCSRRWSHPGSGSCTTAPRS